MIAIHDESVRLVPVKKGQVLRSQEVTYALQLASSNFCYAKFYSDKYFIQVNFMRDLSISVSSNITLPQFVTSLNRYSSHWTFSSVRDFIYQWTVISRRIIGW